MTATLIDVFARHHGSGFFLSRLSPFIKLLVLIMAGVAQAWSLATPWDGQPAGWLQYLAMGVLAWHLEQSSSARGAALQSWVFATSWLAATFGWLYVAMNTYGGLNGMVAATAVCALAGALALYYAAAGAALVAWRPAQLWYRSVLFASLWLLAELARGVWLTGFGWGAVGYAHVDDLAAFAPWIGVYGIGALAACLAYGLAAGFTAPSRALPVRALIGLVPVAVASALPLAPFSHPQGQFSVALLQGNIAQNEKFEAGTGVADALGWYGQELRLQTADLVVAPETALPVLPEQLPPGYLDDISDAYATGQRAALLGLPLGNSDSGYTNSVMGFQSRSAESRTDAAIAYRYDKHHLVPFGEFIPPLFRWFTNLMNIPLGDFSRGGVGQSSFDWAAKGQRLAPNVCYEDLFGEELGARFVDASKAPTVLVNVSNLAWFGNTTALDQHRQISRMRALEFERPVLRATNTGDTAIINHLGQVTNALPRQTRGVLMGQVQGRTGVTPYAWWVSRGGVWPWWLMAAAVVVAAWRLRRRSGVVGWVAGVTGREGS